MDKKTEKFLQKIKDKGYWNENLDYSNGKYINSRSPFEVWCKIHKVEVTKKTARELYGTKKKYMLIIKYLPIYLIVKLWIRLGQSPLVVP